MEELILSLRLRSRSRNRHVQRRRRLVRDDQLRVAGEGHRDHHALAHAAGELVREHLVDALAVCDADHLQQLDRARLDGLLVLVLAVQHQHLFDLVADAEHGVQTRHRLLEDHRHEVAAQRLHHTQRGLRDVIGLVAEVQADRALHDLADRALQQLHDRKARHALAAAGFAHDADGLALRHVEGHAVDGLARADVGEEVGAQPVDLEGVGGVLHRRQILRLRHVLSLIAFFVFRGNLAVFLGDPSGLLCGQIAVIFLLCHASASFNASSSGRRRRADRRPRC